MVLIVEKKRTFQDDGNLMMAFKYNSRIKIKKKKNEETNYRGHWEKDQYKILVSEIK